MTLSPKQRNRVNEILAFMAARHKAKNEARDVMLRTRCGCDRYEFCAICFHPDFRDDGKYAVATTQELLKELAALYDVGDARALFDMDYHTPTKRAE